MSKFQPNRLKYVQENHCTCSAMIIFASQSNDAQPSICSYIQNYVSVQVSLNVAACNRTSYVMLSSNLYGNSTGYPEILQDFLPSLTLSGMD